MPTITITLSATAAPGAVAPAQRVSHAVGLRFGLGHDATADEVKAVIIDLLKAWVKEEEQKEAASTDLELT